MSVLGRDRPFIAPIYKLSHTRILGWDKFTRKRDTKFSNRRIASWRKGLRKSSFWRKFKCQTWLHLHFLNRALTVTNDFCDIKLVDGKPQHPSLMVESWKSYFLLFRDLMHALGYFNVFSAYYAEYEEKYADPQDVWIMGRSLLNHPVSHETDTLEPLFQDQLEFCFVRSQYAAVACTSLYGEFFAFLEDVTDEIKQFVEPKSVRSFYFEGGYKNSFKYSLYVRPPNTDEDGFLIRDDRTIESDLVPMD